MNVVDELRPRHSLTPLTAPRFMVSRFSSIFGRVLLKRRKGCLNGLSYLPYQGSTRQAMSKLRPSRLRLLVTSVEAQQRNRKERNPMINLYIKDRKGTLNTREEWLEALTNILRSDFDEAGYPLPDEIHFSCGWPSVRPSRRIGECWPRQAAADNHHNIFISPLIQDPLRVGDILIHELCHTAVGTAAGHRAPFRKAAIAMGLTGPMTATWATEQLALFLSHILKKLGPYPHGTLALRNPDVKKQKTRLIKLACPDCGYTVRTTQKWIEEGLPLCPKHQWLQPE